MLSTLKPSPGMCHLKEICSVSSFDNPFPALPDMVNCQGAWAVFADRPGLYSSPLCCLHESALTCCPRHVSSWHPVLDWPLCSCRQGRIADIGNGAFSSIAASLLRKLNSCSHLLPPAACHGAAWLGPHTPNRQMVITYSASAGKKKKKTRVQSFSWNPGVL